MTRKKDSALQLFGERTANPHNGAILVTSNVGPRTNFIMGAATLNDGCLNGKLTIHQHNTKAPLFIGARLYTSGSCLIKTGPGELILTNENNRVADCSVWEGVLAFTHINNRSLPSAVGSAGTLQLGSATLRYIGADPNGHETDRQVRVRGKAVIEASGAGPLTFTHATPVDWANTGNPLLTLAGNGEGVIRGKLDLRGGRLIKDGPGAWTFTAASTNSFIWGCDVLNGTLTLDGHMGRDVQIFKKGTLAGSGFIQRNLTVHDGGIISIAPDSLLLTPGSSTLTVGKNLILHRGASLDLPQKLPSEWTAVINVFGKVVDFENLKYPDNAYVRYNPVTKAIEAMHRPVGTLLMVR